MNTEPLNEEPAEYSDPIEMIAQRHRERALDEELSKLPQKYRNAIVLHFLEGHTYQETATALGTTEPAIRGRLQRAKKELKHRLMQRGIAFSVTFAALDTSFDVASPQLISSTTSQVVDPTTAHPDLSPLLAKEPIMFSKLSLGIIAAGAIGIAGIGCGDCF